MTTRIVMAGGQNIGCMAFDSLRAEGYVVAGVIARADDTGEDGTFPSLMKKALAHNIPVIRPEKVNSQGVLDFLDTMEADILLSAMYNQIFRAPIIDRFADKLGVVNIHYAPLPRYCGFWPEMWAIWQEEQNFAISYHYVDAGVDTGEILYQRKIDIEPTETRPSLYAKCDAAAMEVLRAHHADFLTTRQPATAQDASAKTYFRRELPNGGFIDLDWDRETIERFIRATSFYPFIGAKLKIGEKVYSIIDKDLPFFQPHRVGEEV